ncbi:MAG: 5'-nucleotidase [Caulobacterales bacterium]|nr:5'-nucleotidase [Caulobacterales bacterium]MCA0372171.1 5'-nucleotidase [Pseudomonadota bacterium]
MAYPIESKLVVAVSSTALFDFSAEHQIYLTQGLDAFREFQLNNRSIPPKPGAAYPFIKRLLNLNNVFPDKEPVEVVILSRNHPDAGLRMMDALEGYGLKISRAFFLAGTLPYPYMKSVNAVLYLSTDPREVKEAIDNGYPAGHVLPCKMDDVDEDNQLRIAFDFDGVIADDEAEGVFQDGGLPLFHYMEQQNRYRPLNSGPLMPLLKRISDLQSLERERSKKANNPEKSIRVSIVTARNAPAHERLMTTLKSFDIETDELFLTGGIEKKNILDVLKPQIFFDDQLGHLEPASDSTPCVHIPFGLRNN